MSREKDVNQFYEILENRASKVKPLRLDKCDSKQEWPQRGVYLFFEDSEVREGGGMPRVVRVGTHALKEGSRTSLWDRLRQHRGFQSGEFAPGGNHRGSVFRLHVGQALIRRDGVQCPSWSKCSSAPEEIRRAEQPVEKLVSEIIGSMSILWIPILDPAGPKSLRGYVERNAISLLSNYGRKPVDPPSSGWLGRLSPNPMIQLSGLWNVNHVQESYDPRFLGVLNLLVSST